MSDYHRYPPSCKARLTMIYARRACALLGSSRAARCGLLIACPSGEPAQLRVQARRAKARGADVRTALRATAGCRDRQHRRRRHRYLGRADHPGKRRPRRGGLRTRLGTSRRPTRPRWSQCPDLVSAVARPGAGGCLSADRRAGQHTGRLIWRDRPDPGPRPYPRARLPEHCRRPAGEGPGGRSPGVPEGGEEFARNVERSPRHATWPLASPTGPVSLNHPGFGRDSLLGSGDQADQVAQLTVPATMNRPHPFGR